MSGRTSDARGGVSPEDRALAAVPLVRAIVDDLAPQLPEVAVDDLLSAGLVALMDAASRFEPEVDGDFAAYAGALVRSALLLDLRSSELEAGPTALGTLPEPVSAEGWLRSLESAIVDLWTRRMPGEDLDDEEAGLAASRLVRRRAEALMMLRDALRATTEEPDGDDDLIAARQASYAAIAERHAMLRAQVLGRGDQDDELRQA